MATAKPGWGWATALLWALASPHAQAHEADAVARDCHALVTDYAYYRDRYDADAYADLFAQDAVLSVLGNEYVGRAAIKRRLVEDAEKPVTHHHMTTIKLMPGDEKTAYGVSYVVVYSEPAAGDLPVTTKGFLAAGEYHDTFVLTDDGWKIGRRQFRPVLVPPAP